MKRGRPEQDQTFEVSSGDTRSTDSVREMGECKGSVSPKLDKACIDGDRVDLDGEQTSRFRSSVIESRKGTRTQKGKVVVAIVETSKALTVTERCTK